MRSPIVEGATLKEALAKLAERYEGQDNLTVTGVRRAGRWRVQGSVQRARCRCAVGQVHHGNCPDWTPGRVQ